MSQDPLLSRELKSLREELATAQRQRPAKSAATQAASTVGSEETQAESTVGTGPAGIGAAPTGQLEESPAERKLSGQLRDLVKEVTDFVDEAEGNVAAHPAMSIVGAMLLGIAIGSLLARR